MEGGAVRPEGEDRLDAEADEALAVVDLLRSRTLADVARAALHRGDAVVVGGGQDEVRGLVVHVDGDLLVLDSAGGPVDVRLGAPLWLRVVEPAAGPGRPTGRGAGSFTARLFEHEAAGVAVEAALVDGRGLTGRVAAVARDHVVLDALGGTRWHVATSALLWVRVRTS